MRLISILVLAAAAAFCAVPTRAASEAQAAALAPPEVPNPSLVPKAPARGQPAAPAIMPAEKPAQADIVLVLPLQSPDYQRAAEAVRDGFLAAADAARPAQRVKVIGHADGEVLAAFAAAWALGPGVIVGPLVRDDLRSLVASDAGAIPTIALNQLDDASTLPASVYTLALAIESDARVLARRARDDGIGSIVVVGGDTPLMKRFASAFVGEWILSGGPAPQSLPFVPTPEGLASLRRDIARVNADAVLIAVDGPDAALARSFAPRLPAYASALVVREQQEPWLRDLEDVRFVDVPWLVAPESPTIVEFPRREYASAALDRLYALGLDAFRVAQAFGKGAPTRYELEGATGHIALGSGHAFVREGQVAVVRHGQVAPLDGGR